LAAGREGSGGTWGKAVEVPGTAALNTGRGAAITSVSCASAGNCSAGGYYADSHRGEAFVVSQAHGIWGKAIEVPGTAALNRGRDAEIASVSCASAGNCSAGGRYFRYSSGFQVFVVSQAHGIWGKAIEVPGTAALNTDGEAEIASVSCGSPGNCSAGGYADDIPSLGPKPSLAFVVSQAHGIWGKAIVVPSVAALNGGRPAAITSVSCPSAGNCSAGGDYYTDRNNSHIEVFVVSET
jgi:hypothetical protein